MAFPLIPPKSQWVDSNGDPLVGGSLEFQDPATSNPKDSYPTHDDAEVQTNPNANPITLDSRGEAAVFLRDGEQYKVILRDSDNVILWTIDDVQTAASATSAAGVSIADAGGYYVATDVEAALQELGAITGAGIIGIQDAGGNFAATDVEAALAEIVDDLAATTAGNGASKVGVEDSAGLLTATDVEAALAELAAILNTNKGGATVVSTANDTSTDETFTNHAEINGLSVVSGGRYKVDALINWNNSGTGGMICKFDTAMTPSNEGLHVVSTDTNGATTKLDEKSALESNIILAEAGWNTGVDVTTRITGTFTAGATDTVNFQFRLNSGNGTTTITAGSYVRLVRLA